MTTAENRYVGTANDRPASRIPRRLPKHLMCFGNLRGIREAGRAFAVPTYLFSAIVILLIAVGLLREAFGSLGHYRYPLPEQYGHGVAHSQSGLITFGLIFVLMRAFANGGSSLTGIE